MHSEELSSLIRFHRKHAKLSQIRLAELAGVSRSVVQDLEAGGGTTAWGNVQAVLKVLNISLVPEGPLVATWRRETEARP